MPLKLINITFVFFSVLYLFLLNKIAFPINAIFKILPIMVLIVIAQKLLKKGIIYLPLKLALVFSLIGDVILTMPAKNAFIFGLLSFLIAHLCFIKQFWAKPNFNIVNSSLSITIIGSVSFMLWLIEPSLGALTVPVICYMSVISIMAITACLAENSSFLLKVGVVSFLCSDSFLACSMFLNLKFDFSYAILISYYLAQYCIVKFFIAQKISLRP